jgi:hypothetical protein
MTAEIEALLKERAGYIARGKTDRVRQVDAQLAALGHQSATIETADDTAEVETAVKRGRPRKAG